MESNLDEVMQAIEEGATKYRSTLAALAVLGDTSIEEVAESLTRALQQAVNGERIPLSEMWDGIEIPNPDFSEPKNV